MILKRNTLPFRSLF